MSFRKFTEDTKVMKVGREPWLIHAHFASSDSSEHESATACIFTQSDKEASKEIPSVPTHLARVVRRTGFGQAAYQRRVRMSDLRKAVGRPRWRPGSLKLRQFGPAVVDAELLARAVSCVKHDGYATFEVFRFTLAGVRGFGVRVIGRDWRIVVAGRREPYAAPLFGSSLAKSVEQEKKA